MKIYKEWMTMCRQADLPAISTDTAARLMAVLYEYGNNEGFTYNEKFLVDKEYIQDRFGLRETKTPDPEFHRILKEYIKEIEDYRKAHPHEGIGGKPVAPEWCPRLLKERYNMNFIG